MLLLLGVLGPGLISAAAGNDAGGVATYASDGASYGYGLLWTLIPLLIGLVVIQEMCARMGAVTQKGLADLIREEFGVRWTAFAMLCLLIANGGIVVTEFLGIRASVQVLAGERYLAGLSGRAAGGARAVVAGDEGQLSAGGKDFSADGAGLLELYSGGLPGKAGLGPGHALIRLCRRSC